MPIEIIESYGSEIENHREMQYDFSHGVNDTACQIFGLSLGYAENFYFLKFHGQAQFRS